MLGSTIGSLLVISWLGAGLTGSIFLQAYFYFRNKPKDDPRVFSNIVLMLCFLDAAHISCVMASVYGTLINNFGDQEALLLINAELALSVGITAIITLIVQSFFCWRLWRLTPTLKFVAIPVVILLVIRLAFGLEIGIRAIQLKNYSDFMEKARVLFIVGLTLGVACDIAVTSGLCIWLYNSREKAHSMRSTIDKIIIYTVENGALTSLTSITSLVCVLTMPHNYIFFAVHILIGKLFINSFLTSLNNRSRFREQNDQDVFSSLRFADPQTEIRIGHNLSG